MAETVTAKSVAKPLAGPLQVTTGAGRIVGRDGYGNHGQAGSPSRPNHQSQRKTRDGGDNPEPPPPPSSTAQPVQSTLARREERMAWGLLTPSLLVLLCIAIYPLGQVSVSSFTNDVFASSQPVRFVGLDNYRQLLSLRIVPLEPKLNDAGQQLVDEQGRPQYENSRLKLVQLARAGTLVFDKAIVAEDGSVSYQPERFDRVFDFSVFGKRYVLAGYEAGFARAVWDTLVFTIMSVGLETLLGLIIALSLHRKFIGQGLMRTAMLVPWAIITVVSGLIWEWMYKADRSGFFNALLDRLGVGGGSVAFLTAPALQMPSVIAIDVWKTTPFMALLLLAGLATIPQELYEAARVDGASAVRQFFSITLPMLVPTLAVALIFRTLDALRVFDLFQVIFGESRYSMASFAQDTLTSQKDVGLSSAASMVIFVLILIFAVLYIRLLGVDSE